MRFAKISIKNNKLKLSCTLLFSRSVKCEKMTKTIETHTHPHTHTQRRGGGSKFTGCQIYWENKTWYLCKIHTLTNLAILLVSWLCDFHQFLTYSYHYSSFSMQFFKTRYYLFDLLFYFFHFCPPAGQLWWSVMSSGRAVLLPQISKLRLLK